MPVFHSGEHLTLDEASGISKSSLANLIVVGGRYGAGKTTLATSIYGKFLRADYAGYNFSGTKTAIAWERTSYLSRLNSPSEDPDTEHTPANFVDRYFHLGIRELGNKSAERNLLISDWPGELFRMACDSEVEATKLSSIANSTQFCLVMDGALFAETEGRQEELRFAQMILHRLTQMRYLGSQSVVSVVYSKWDLIQDAEDRATAENFAELSQRTLQKSFSGKFGKLTFFRTAMRRSRKNDTVPAGFGMDELLRSWVDDTPSSLTAVKATTEDSDVTRMIDRTPK